MFVGMLGTISIVDAFAQQLDGERTKELSDELKQNQKNISDKQKDTRPHNEANKTKNDQIDESNYQKNNLDNISRDDVKKIQENRKDRESIHIDAEVKNKIKTKIKEKVLDDIRNEIKSDLAEQVDILTKKILKQKLEIEKYQYLGKDIRKVLNGTLESIPSSDERLEYELHNDEIGALHGAKSSLTDEQIIDELNPIKDRIDYKTKLIKAKIKNLGQDDFDLLKKKYKNDIRENAKQKFEEIKSQIKLRGLIDHVEGGSYHGIQDISSKTDFVTYVFEFSGIAEKKSNSNIVKDVNGKIVMELIDLGNVNAKFRIVGGQFFVLDSNTDSDGKVWDVSSALGESDER